MVVQKVNLKRYMLNIATIKEKTMSLEKIILESMNGNPLDVKGLFEQEMRNRIALALEAKAEKLDEQAAEDLGELLAESAEAVARHNATINAHADDHYEKAGYHQEVHPDQLANLRHAHSSIAKIHDAHRTLHTHAGNHEAADDHEEASRIHRECHDMSTPGRGSKRVSGGYKFDAENHEEYSNHSSHAQDATATAFKHKLPKH